MRAILGTHLCQARTLGFTLLVVIQHFLSIIAVAQLKASHKNLNATVTQQGRYDGACVVKISLSRRVSEAEAGAN